jgi:peptidoglycan/LPS O-acetylase OafA/YrhL
LSVPRRDPSYGVYFFHWFIFCAYDAASGRWLVIRFTYWLSKRIGLTPYLAMDLLKMGTTLAVAVVSWRLVERPLLLLKDRFGYRAREAEAAPAIVGGYGRSPERRPHESAPMAGSIH